MSNGRYSRQSFLGPNANEQVAQCTLGFAGLGGGGSHVVQQCALIDFQRYVLFDEDLVEESNLNRLVSAGTIDALAHTFKLHLAKTVIFSLQSSASVKGFASKWQENPEALRECQIVFGCVDDYKGRHELEVVLPALSHALHRYRHGRARKRKPGDRRTSHLILARWTLYEMYAVSHR